MLKSLTGCFERVFVRPVDNKDEALRGGQVVAGSRTAVVGLTRIHQSDVDILIENTLEVETDGRDRLSELRVISQLEED
jgi:hypothetical protein